MRIQLDQYTQTVDDILLSTFHFAFHAMNCGGKYIILAHTRRYTHHIWTFHMAPPSDMIAFYVPVLEMTQMKTKQNKVQYRGILVYTISHYTSCISIVRHFNKRHF